MSSKLEFTGGGDSLSVTTILFDSTHRNRTRYPFPSEFRMELNQLPSLQDPVCDGIPWFASPVIVSDSTFDRCKLLNFQPAIDQYPIPLPHGTITMIGTNMASNQHIVLIQKNVNYDVYRFDSIDLCSEPPLPPFFRTFPPPKLTIGHNTFPPNGNYCFVIRRSKAVGSIDLRTQSTPTSITLDPTSSSTDGYYNGQFIWIPYLDSFNYWRIFAAKILSYNGTSKEIKVDKEIDPTLIQNCYYEISSSVYDNYNSILPTAAIKQFPETYMVRLISLMIPTGLIYLNGNGVNIYTNRNLFVHIGNSSRAQNDKIITTTERSEFIIPINDMAQFVGSSYLHLSDCYMELPLRLNLSEPLFFGVYFEDGEPLIVEDYFSPFEPNYQSQIVAIFRLVKDCRIGNHSMMEKNVTVVLPNGFI